MDALASLVDALASGAVTVVDLTQPLSSATPLIQLPPPFVNTPGWTLHELSHYDDRGPAWYWNSFERPFPCHSFLLGAGKLGLTQLASLSELPPTGAMLIVAPLKIVKGSGSPCRALALVPA